MQDFDYPPPQIHLVSGSRLNHLTNSQDYLQRNYDVMNDQTTVMSLVSNYICDKLNDKGLNFSTSYFLNTQSKDPVEPMLHKNFLTHSYIDGNTHFLLGSNPDIGCVTNLDKEEAEEFRLNGLAQHRVNQVRQKEKLREKIQWEGVRKDMYNTFFRMKNTVANINAEEPKELKEMKKEEVKSIKKHHREYLIPNRARKPKHDIKNIDEAKTRNLAGTNYMNLQSSQKREKQYEEFIFQEKLKENQENEVMEKLEQRMKDEKFEEVIKRNKVKAKEFVRLLMVRELMMKEERDNVVKRRLEEELLEKEEEEQVKNILRQLRGEKIEEPPAKVLGIAGDADKLKKSIAKVKIKHGKIDLTDFEPSHPKNKDILRTEHSDFIPSVRMTISSQIGDNQVQTKQQKKRFRKKLEERTDLKNDHIKSHLKTLTYRQKLIEGMKFTA